MTEPLLTIAEAARRMNVKIRTVYRMVDANELPAVKLRTGYRPDGTPKRPTYRIRPEAIDALGTGTHNPEARGVVPVKQEAPCQEPRVSTKKMGISGRVTRAPMEDELGALLGFPSEEERRERAKRKR